MSDKTKHEDLKEAVLHLENLIIETDTKAGREIIEETVNFVVTETQRAIRLIKKSYDSPPELVKGMWVMNNGTPFLYIGESGDPKYPHKGITLDGRDIETCNSLPPVEFTESDLSLLNTEEVVYELEKRSKDGYYYVSSYYKNNNECCMCFPNTTTIHEAIESVFTITAKLALADKQLNMEASHG